MPEPALNNKSFFDYFPGNMLTVIANDTMAYNKYTAVTLNAENRAGKPIYFVPNEVDGTRRLDDKVTKCRSVFLDDDKHIGASRQDEFAIRPNLVIETSPGKFHYHWLTSTTDKEAWKRVISGMIKRYDTDPACSNPARIMRVPGYVNTKPEYNGWVVRLTVLHEERYTWEEIEEAFPPAAEVAQADFSDKPKFDMVEAFEEFLTGENVHESRRGIAMRCVNMGMETDDILALLMSVLKRGMEDGTIDQSRGKERAANMKQAVTSAYNKRQAELNNVVAITPDIDDDDQYTRMPRPPGALADVADDVMAYMPFSSWEMALPVAMHCVSMFGGGIWRLGSTTGCRKREILAASTRGKSICSRYPKEIMRRLAVGDKSFKHNPYDYGGTAGWTPTTVHTDLVDHRVRGYVVSESGLDMKSKAGSKEEVRKLWLDLLTASHKSHVESKKYSMRSDKGLNEKLGDVYGAVVVQMCETVPVHYMEALRGSNAHEGGDTGRTEVVFVDPTRGKRNRNNELEVSDKVVQMMKLFVRKFEDMGCAAGDNPANPDKFIKLDNSAIEDAWYEYDDLMIDKCNECHADPVRATLYGRFMERVNTTILIQAMADAAYGKTELTHPVVTMEHLEYAIAYHEELDRTLLAQLSGGVLADPLTRCCAVIAARMDDFGSLDDKKFADVVNRTITQQWLTRKLSKRPEWRQLIDLNGGQRLRAQNELNNALEADGILIPLPQAGKVKKWRLNK